MADNAMTHERRLYWADPRGIGLSRGACMVCGCVADDLRHDCAFFVPSRETGEAIVALFQHGAKLDYRPSEPRWCQVKVTACGTHRHNLESLVAAVSGTLDRLDGPGISAEMVADFVTPAAPPTPTQGGDTTESAAAKLRALDDEDICFTDITPQLREAADLIEAQAAEIARLTAERDGILSALSEDQAEQLEHHAVSRDNLRVMDYIADKIGLPHDVELDESNFCTWFSHVAEAEAALATLSAIPTSAASVVATMLAGADAGSYGSVVSALMAEIECVENARKRTLQRALDYHSAHAAMMAERDAALARVKAMREALEKCADGYAALTKLLTGGPIYEGGKRVGMAALAMHSKAGEECARAALSMEAAPPTAQGGEGGARG